MGLIVEAYIYKSVYYLESSFSDLLQKTVSFYGLYNETFRLDIKNNCITKCPTQDALNCHFAVYLFKIVNVMPSELDWLFKNLSSVAVLRRFPFFSIRKVFHLIG